MAQAEAHIIDRSVVRKSSGLKDTLLDKAFATAFRGLVYAQIWEDPVVDMEGLQIDENSRVLCIASGSCNALSYLTANPEAITAVDLNRAHIALGRLKIAAINALPSYDLFRRFFAHSDYKENVAIYKDRIAPLLDDESRKYWEGRDIRGRRRITQFQRGIYKQGLLGNFIGMAHLFAKLYGVDLRKVLEAPTVEQQREVFEAELAPVFDKKFVRWVTNQPASLFGLGIPPAQYDALAGDEKMAEVLRKRLEKLACDFDVKDNYFAWQAFNRGYSKDEDAPLPPYLQRENYADLRDRVAKLSVQRANLSEFLSSQPAMSLDRYVFLDAQDWMDDHQLTTLWREVTRTARKGARVLFRTAAEPSLLPGRVPDEILDQWTYHDELSKDLTQRDRSSIYGGVHLYELA